MIHTCPTCKSDSDKRQVVKDTKKNMKQKFGDQYTIPEVILSRIQSAINSK